MVQNKSNRKEDVKISNLVSSYLDKHFFKIETSNFERVTDKERQLQGIDVIFDLNGQHYVCDEKSATDYINKNLPSFIVEIEHMGGPNFDLIREGWFVSKNCVNNTYLFIWVNKADSDKPTHIDEIHEVEIALVQKDKIQKYLEAKGWPEDRLKENAVKIRNKNSDAIIGNLYKDGYQFTRSNQKTELSINVRIPRWELRKMSDYNIILVT